MSAATTTSVVGGEIMEAAFKRPEDQPLITVSNHVAALDDPLVVAAVTPSKVLVQPQHVRCIVEIPNSGMVYSSSYAHRLLY